jgi:thiamine transporter
LRFNNLKTLTETGMLIATGLALALLKGFPLPAGGSLSLSCLPLVLIGARHGTRVGIISGGLFGVLLLMNRPTIAHPAQFILDYPLAYASFGLAGALKWNTSLKAITATTIANIVRLHFHVVAGAIFFITDKESIIKTFIASYAYNLSHMLPETLACGLFAFYLAKNHKDLCKRQ